MAEIPARKIHPNSEKAFKAKIQDAKEATQWMVDEQLVHKNHLGTVRKAFEYISFEHHITPTSLAKAMRGAFYAEVERKLPRFVQRQALGKIKAMPFSYDEEGKPHLSDVQWSVLQEKFAKAPFLEAEHLTHEPLVARRKKLDAPERKKLDVAVNIIADAMHHAFLKYSRGFLHAGLSRQAPHSEKVAASTAAEISKVIIEPRLRRTILNALGKQKAGANLDLHDNAALATLRHYEKNPLSPFSDNRPREGELHPQRLKFHEIWHGLRKKEEPQTA